MINSLTTWIILNEPFFHLDFLSLFLFSLVLLSALGLWKLHLGFHLSTLPFHVYLFGTIQCTISSKLILSYTHYHMEVYQIRSTSPLILHGMWHLFFSKCLDYALKPIVETMPKILLAYWSGTSTQPLSFCLLLAAIWTFPTSLTSSLICWNKDKSLRHMVK